MVLAAITGILAVVYAVVRSRAAADRLRESNRAEEEMFERMMLGGSSGGAGLPATKSEYHKPAEGPVGGGPHRPTPAHGTANAMMPAYAPRVPVAATAAGGFSPEVAASRAGGDGLGPPSPGLPPLPFHTSGAERANVAANTQGSPAWASGFPINEATMPPLSRLTVQRLRAGGFLDSIEGAVQSSDPEITGAVLRLRGGRRIAVIERPMRSGHPPTEILMRKYDGIIAPGPGEQPVFISRFETFIGDMIKL